MGETFGDIASGGPLLLAVGVALVAGLVSFLSPCVLPLVPGYLSYVTGLVGSGPGTTPRSRRPDRGEGPSGGSGAMIAVEQVFRRRSSGTPGCAAR